MKKTLFLWLFLAALPSFVYTQDLSEVPYIIFKDSEVLSCPYQPASTVAWPKHWRIYQTLDNLWDGPIDSSRCISVIPADNSRLQIELEQVDPEKAVFIRQTLPEENGLVLFSDYVYKISGALKMDQDLLRTGDECNGSICSGVIVVVEIPDEAGTGVIRRIHTANFESNFDNLYAQACLVTEYFEKNTAREVILKVSFQGALAGSALYLNNVSFQPPYDGVNPISELVFPDNTFTGEAYEANISQVTPEEGNGIGPYLFLHEREVYPGLGNLTYVEARPATLIAEAANLRVSVVDYQSVLFQPQTAVRGALIDPLDTIRHRLTLINDGSEFCFTDIVELVVTDGTEVEFRAGGVDFGGPNSCMMFRDGGTLVIPDGTRFVYGSEGVGALGLDKGGTIRIGENSELVLNNTVILANFKTGIDRQVYVELNPGSRLTFGEDARLIRKGHVETGQMRLNVFMKGGILNDSNLSDKEKELINRIYPEQTPLPTSDWLRIQGNPTRDILKLAVQAKQNNLSGQWIIRSLNGQELRRGSFTASQGLNTLEVDLENLAGGMYTVEMRLNGDRAVQKFIAR